MDGEAIYNDACQACHLAGAAGAPQLVAEQWTERLDKGMETLVSHAINGFNAMPAKGGRMDLSDEQVRASVEYMVDQVEQ
jgi:cytochrome c5